jgi:hypothetical protein
MRPVKFFPKIIKEGEKKDISLRKAKKKTKNWANGKKIRPRKWAISQIWQLKWCLLSTA